MEPKKSSQRIAEGRETPISRFPRASFSMKALRTFSVGSQLSSSSETDLPASVTGRRRVLQRPRPTKTLKEDLGRKPSKSSAEDNTERTSTSTRPTSPSWAGSQATSISGDFVNLVKSGPLQPEASILKSKKEYLVLTSAALVKCKNHLAAVERYPQILTPNSTVDTLTSTGSVNSSKDSGAGTEVYIPLERVVSVFKDEGTRPSFGIEVWWSNPKSAAFACVQLDFSLPDERDDWLKQIRHAIKLHTRSFVNDRAPSDSEFDLKETLEAKQPQSKEASIDVYPVVPRRPYIKSKANSSEVKKGWRDNSSFYLAFNKNFCILAHISKSSTGRQFNPSLVQFGLVTLSKVNVIISDERFDLVFRLPLDKPVKLELSSRHHKNILSTLFEADTYLKPAWPLWTRREVFFIDGEAQQTPLPNGEDYGGFKTTLEAFIKGYNCLPVNWTVRWKHVQHPHVPEFRLLPPKKQSRYTAHQLLAVFRALRFNDFFRSLSFAEIDFSSLVGASDNVVRLESTVWLSRTGKRSLTRDEFELVENSSVLFQELVALLLGSESVRHIDLRSVLSEEPARLSESTTSTPSPSSRVCEVISPVVLLWKSLQTRCSSVCISGNPLGVTDVAGLSRTLQNRPDLVKAFDVSRCQLDETALVLLWEGIHEQRSTLETLDISQNSGRIDAMKLSQTLNEATKLRRLNLAYSIKGHLDGPLFRPWSTTSNFQPWSLEEIDLSGWKINFDTLCGIMKFLEPDESCNLRRLALNNCGLSGEMATGIFCRVGAGRNIHLLLNENPLELGSTDWIDLIHGNEAPKMIHLDMIMFQHESNFNRLLKALAHNKTIEFLSMVGTGPPNRASTKTSELLSTFFQSNDALRFLDLSGYSGKLEDSHLGCGLTGAMGGLKHNTTLRQLRVQNHDIGAGEDVTELCRVLASNKGLAMLDCQNNNLNHHQFAKLVHALSFNPHIISFPVANTDREYAVQREKRQFMQQHAQRSKSLKITSSKSVENRLEGLLTWLERYWDYEANKVREILERNRNDPDNHALDFEGEYLDAWNDRSLSSWIIATPGSCSKGKEKNSSQRDDSPQASLSATSSSSALGDGNTSPCYGTPAGALSQTYTINEESSSIESQPVLNRAEQESPPHAEESDFLDYADMVKYLAQEER
ncbi:RNI-like protein [Xylariaceae sp. FL0662B]|nr:RNI-like protein [Xylariaceae sp. FL0662B]